MSFVFLRNYGQGVTRHTPTGISVNAVQEDEFYSLPQIIAATLLWQDSVIAGNDWDASIIGLCSTVYNCHGYAWHLSDGGDTIKITNDSEVSKYYTGNGDQNATYKRVYNPAKFKKVYYNGASHSAIVDPYNSSRLISKWGPGPLVNHLPGDSPYDNYTLEYYELIMDDLPASVAKGCAVNVSTLNIDSATYNWSALNNYVCAAGAAGLKLLLEPLATAVLFKSTSLMSGQEYLKSLTFQDQPIHPTTSGQLIMHNPIIPRWESVIIAGHSTP